MVNPHPKQSTTNVQPLSTRLIKLVKHPQFVWFLGHWFTAISIPLIILRISDFQIAYYRALLGAVVSYGIVLYRHYKSIVLNQGFKLTRRKILLDLNAHYFGLALYFWISSYPSMSLLVPYTSFSVFHCLGYIKDMLIPTIFPAVTTGSSSSHPPFLIGLTDKIAKFSLKYQPQALHLASYWEITVTPVLILMELLLMNQSIFAPIVYLQFISIRYLTSVTTRNACSAIRQVLDSKLVPWSTHANTVLKMVGLAYVKVRDTMSQFMENHHSKWN